MQLIEKLDKKEIGLYSMGKNFTSDNLIVVGSNNLPYLYKTSKPAVFTKNIFKLVWFSLVIARICWKKKINIIHANTIKSAKYGLLASLFLKSKLIWHVRDNVTQNLITRSLQKRSEKIICISEHVYHNVLAPKGCKQIIYGGIDIKHWSPHECRDNLIKKAFNLSQNIKIIANISQLTHWKNHLDYVRSASEIIHKTKDVHFLIIGDDLTGRELNYRKEIENLIAKLNLKPFFTFIGFHENIKQTVAQIDVLVHTAINEPFGRILIEAMAMEKPIVAYKCGGPKEIIINNETGYLVEPQDYHALADKSAQLIADKELRDSFGKAGRKRVVEKFNIERYVREMEEAFDSL